MAKSRPFLGETNDRERALAGFESIDVHVVQDPFEHYALRPGQRERHFTKGDLPRRLSCVNPRCQQGGLDLQQLVEFLPSGKRTYPCNGHEGTPQGRRIGTPCDNSFEVTLEVVRRAKENR